MTAREATTNWGAWPTFLDTATDKPACRGHDTNLFFPEAVEGQPGPNAQAAKAKAICRTCPLLNPCRQWALTQPVHQLHGVWGGTTINDRRKTKPRGPQPPQFRRTRPTEGEQ